MLLSDFTKQVFEIPQSITAPDSVNTIDVIYNQ